MNGELIIFLILAILSISCSVLVIILKRIAHRVLCMAFTFFAVAGLYFLLRAEFIGIVQIMVYVGALSILFVFGMMMTDHKSVSIGPKRTFSFKMVSFLGVAVLLFLMLKGIFTLDVPGQEYYIGSAEAIGIELYGNYVIAFQGAGILLLAALVGAIVLARKEAD
ncbi:NADH-quinone oxidoreductase subunit J [Anaerobacillus alkalidiazotrophicus]|uniref:NADH-quinone oxidoreductase subunit J n=1 Tax=Anaerobacillus alkalidiazotrophicus TaxID=472963 RepID=A0A1S2MAN8_9BACI|nr:NADH-quinone oxidoreductase subunit J [Anaerobacillus alkalidiazotrophicus]OIJ21778.1 NADH-quinone oxidoreductase subunit J [Anaerobacillus alkalidiazotrophicus]